MDQLVAGNRFSTFRFGKAQAREQIGAAHNPDSLARRYMSDLLGMRISAERSSSGASATAYEIEKSLSRL